MSKAPQKKSDAVDERLRLVRELAKVMEDTGLVEIDLEDDHVSVHLSKTGTMAPAQMMSPMMAAPAPAQSAAASTPVETAKAAAADKSVPDNAITSPMVGTAYLAPEPGAAVFIKEGDNIKAGQTLLIIEAMKVMNPITAPSTGTVRQILVDDGQPVEFGEPLVVID
ncbi:MAG: acetyl-CoA carboxylase, biotin carboxyl carrier protein [Candidatus Puniceispirillum sp. TMED52]|nr:acetyl-CoA carboxylase, biotin carboxyl carrier protein [SAR116 cluster bacterium]OUU44142.1 MAG: acetyl-CoA carboxylase, biotin carboxyl carrier protein [Candidatus Puniceispirillum sp. TMED52]HCP18794.1 acetyl-CoA carboxylase biotin carboxyl carrier protein [Alphaproteobacteria bacterium]|tara:strand:+ start:1305 stop:1805 length:501 start_codon:yes stop_codon:yes gene_type:complete